MKSVQRAAFALLCGSVGAAILALGVSLFSFWKKEREEIERILPAATQERKERSQTNQLSEGRRLARMPRGTETDLLTLAKWPAPGALHGIVSNSNQHRIPDALVSVSLNPEASFLSSALGGIPPVKRETRTDAQGRYQLTIERRESLIVLAKKKGWASACAQASAGERLDFVLFPEAKLSVRVVDTTRSPVPDARVMVLVPPAGLHSSTRTFPDGVALLDQLPAGIVTVVIDHVSHVRVKEEVSTEEGETTSITVVLTPGREVLGLVYDAVTGEPVPEARVSLHHLEHHSVRSDAWGEFYLQGIPNVGTWGIHVEAVPYGIATQYVSFDDTVGVQRVEFGLERGRELFGRVVSASGPISSARVVVFGYYGDSNKGAVGGDQTVAESDSDGYFRLAWLRRDIKHAVMASHPKWARTSVAVLPGKETEVDLGDMVLAAACTLSGIVVDSYEEPVRDLEVVLRGQVLPEIGGSVTTETYTDIGNLFEPVFREEKTATHGEGAFEFHGLPAGVYDLRVQGEPFIAVGRRLTIEADDFVDVRVVKGASVEGRVHDSQRRAIEYADVSLSWIRKQEIGEFGNGVSYETARALSDHEGSYRFESVPRGLVILEVKQSGYVGLRKRMLVGAAHESIEVELETVREGIEREIAALGRHFGWSRGEELDVVELYSTERAWVERKAGLIELFGSEITVELENHDREKHRAKEASEIAESIELLVATFPAILRLPHEEAEYLRTMLSDSSVEICQSAREGLALKGGSVSARWKEVFEKQQGVADELKETLRRRFAEQLGPEIVDQIYGVWRRFQKAGAVR